MLTKVSTVKNSPGFTTKNRNSLNYDLAYAYAPGFAHRLSNVNGRYYGYDLNGNLVTEQDAPIGSLGDTSVLSPIVSERIGEDVYKEDYGWAVTNPDKGKNRKVVGSNVYQRTFIWDERNMMTQSSDSLHTVKYRYGADGQRTNKYSVTGDRGESIYFNKLWTWRRDSFTPSAGNYCKNIFLDKTRIVTKVRAADETSSADAHREYFYHGDHLQSATLITDYEGSVYERINYTPYGELWLEKSDNNGENYLPYRFTGKELDSETGLYYYGARYLDPMYSRWLSCDPALGEYIPQAPVSDEAKKHNQNLQGMGGVFNTVNLSLYNYASNNPIKYTDPDGRNVTNYTNDYIIVRLEDGLNKGTPNEIDTVVLAPGDTYIGLVDGTRDKYGNYTKISCMKGDSIDYSVMPGNQISFDNENSKKQNNSNDRFKKANNLPIINLLKGKKLLSGAYPKDSEGAKFLAEAWNDRFKKDLGEEGFNDFEKAYLSEKQIDLRKKRVVSNAGGGE